MFICVCQAITQQQWDDAVQKAGSIEGAMMATGAGLQCGSCRAWLVLTALPSPPTQESQPQAGLAHCAEVPHSADTQDCEDLP